MQGYAAGARALGATVRVGVGVTGTESDGGQITGVVTSEGVVETSTIVCAAGAWSREVGSWVGVDLPVQPLRRQILETVAGIDQALSESRRQRNRQAVDGEVAALEIALDRSRRDHRKTRR